MKPRARYTPRLRTWALWTTPMDFIWRTVGYGYSLEEAMADRQERCRARWLA